MRIGIITVFDAVNYGSYLQAFCLQEFLKQKGHEVIMIKRSSLLYEKWRFTSLFTYNPKKLVFKNKLLKGYINAWKEFNVSRFPQNLDLLIIGSDEMWEVNNVTFHTRPEFFGLGIEARKKVTYAVSSNSTRANDIVNYPFIFRGIREFSAISVRDQSTYDTYRSLIEDEPVFSLDPTLIFDLYSYLVPTTESNYILCYTYTFKPYMIETVKKLASNENKKIIVVGQQFDWADKCIPATPFEFLGLINNADFIVTDTFHGATLSIALKKNFVAFAYKTKVYKELELFNMLDRNIDGCSDITEQYKKRIDYRVIYDNYITPLRNASLSYLNMILETES